MPKKVDHDARRRQITDAVCRITLRGGLGAATFRQIAAEANMSVRLVQYYFGTKEHLLDVTLQHVGERSIVRLTNWIEATDCSPRAILGAFLKSFVPVDEESRVAGIMYFALAAQNVVGAQSAAAEMQRETEAQMMLATTTEQLERGPLVEGVNVDLEAKLLTGMMPGLGYYVLDGTMTADEVYLTIDYHLDRLFVADRADSTNTPPVAEERRPKEKS